MNWFDWLLVAILGVGAIVSVLLVGEERKPIAPGTAALQVILNASLIGGILITRGLV